MEYNKFTIEELDNLLIELTLTKKGKKLLEDLEYWSIKYVGNGLYTCGNIMFGTKGLEELDKVMKQKVLEYGNIFR